MHPKELQLAIGPDRYNEAAQLAKKTAADTGKSMPPEHPILWKLPQEIGDVLWGQSNTTREKIDELVAVYREMPCYGLLNYVGDLFESLDEEEKLHFWTQCIDILDDEERLFARPLEYFLWCDFFERGDRVEDAWENLVTPETPQLALRSILLVSGPVPFDLKLSVYERLLTNPQWHQWIFLSILHSYSEKHGNFEKEPAIRILEQLLIPRTTPNLLELQKALGMKPSLRVL